MLAVTPSRSACASVFLHEQRYPLRELRSLISRAGRSRAQPCAARGAPLEPLTRPAIPWPALAARGSPLSVGMRLGFCFAPSAQPVAAPRGEKSPTHPAGANTSAHWLPSAAARVPARSDPAARLEWCWLAH